MRVATRLRPLGIGLAAAATLGAMALPSAALAASAPHVASARVLPGARLPEGTRVLGATPASTRIHASIYLAPRSAAALAHFVAAVNDVHSPMFHHYLARGAFAARFGPSAASIRAVESFARDEGLRIESLAPNHLALGVVGTAGRFATAFSTRFAQVRFANGVSGRVTTEGVHLTASIASAVEAVVGLDDVLKAHNDLMHVSQLRRPTATSRGRSFPDVRPKGAPGAPSACSDATKTTEEGFGGITDDQVAHAYGADGLYTAGDLGAGQTVAIFELEPFLMSDLKAFDECYFGSDRTSQVSLVNVDGGPGTGPGSGEAALDVQNVAALAPDAKILVYQAPNTNYGSLDAYNRIVTDDRAQVVTSSWGFCETDQLNLSPGAMNAENLVFEQAAAQGQTVFNAGGDSGNDSCAYNSGFPTNPVLSVGDPASQPYVLGVGGTTAVSVNQPPSEQVWNDGSDGGAGEGGISSVWEQPPWLGATANSLSSAAPCHAPSGEVCRTTPDVSAFADEYTGITIYYDGGWGTIGGTSSSSPIWAGLLALVNASSTCQASQRTANGVGFAAPLLYKVASDPTDYASGFNDITLGNNDLFGVTKGKYAALSGYDLASGLGTPELTAAPGVLGPGLAQSLCLAAQSTSPATVASISPTSGSAAGGTPFTITGSGFFSGGVSDVTAVDFGTSPAASYDVVSNTEITGTTSTASTPSTTSKLNDVVDHSGAVLVSVTTTGGDVTMGPSYHYVVESSSKSRPTLIQIGPTGGSAAGGNTVDLYGTGFTGATSVTFGGEKASFKVLSGTQIAAVAPKLTTAACSAASKVKSLGLCQTEIRVVSPGGASPTVATKKPYAGFFNLNELGEIIVPKKCDCEAYPTITEYDYGSGLKLDKLTNGNGNAFIGDPGGGDEVVLHGTGINVLTLNWVNFGPPPSTADQDLQTLSVSAAGTELETFSLPAPNPGTTDTTTPVSIDTIEGTSNSLLFTYGTIPEITGLSTDVLPSAGGTALTIDGGGFTGVTEVVFAPFSGDFPPDVILSDFTVVSSSKITLPSPSLVPTAYQVYVCGRTECGTGSIATPSIGAVQVIYPGATAVTSAASSPGGDQPITGPTTGGTTFEVQGTNFGPLSDLTVYLVNGLGEQVAATGVTKGPAPTDPGATESIVATSPASLGGAQEFCAIVVMGDDGTSAETGAALFSYTNP